MLTTIGLILLGTMGIGSIFAFMLLGFSLFNTFYIDKYNKEKANKINEIIFTIYAFLFLGEFILGGIEVILIIIAMILGYK